MPFDNKPRAAGGLGAIAHALGHVARRTGLLRGSKALAVLNQVGGTDCPGCAWPEPVAPAHRSAFEFCENGAKAIAEEAMAATANAAFFAAHSITSLRERSDFELGNAGRLAEPLVRRPGNDHYEPIPWDEAIAMWAASMRAAGPARTALYTSGRTSNEAAFIYQLIGRVFGTNNFPDCSNMCHESSGVALRESLGVGKGTVQLSDFDEADLIIVIGQNPGTNHPRMLTTLREARGRGATLVSVNPLREVGLARFSHPQAPLDIMRGGVELAAHHVPVAIGGDLALLQGMGKALLARDQTTPGIIDHEFITGFTHGFRSYQTHLENISWDTIEAGSGVPRATIEALATLYAGANRTIVCWAMGLTQQPHAVATIQEIVNVLLLRGNVGRPGTGVCPVRGHSNVQGDRSMGIDHHLPAFAPAMEEAFGFVAPVAPGLDVVGTIAAAERGDIDLMVCLGGNLVSAAPDTERTAAAMGRTKLTVHIATKLNRSQLYPGDMSLILPCLGRTDIDASTNGEQFVTVEDSMGLVHASRGRLAPASPCLRSEVAILCALGQALLGEQTIPFSAWATDYQGIRRSIEQIIPDFAGFAAPVARNETVQLPNKAAMRVFATASGKAQFTCSQTPELTLPPSHLRLMTIRSHDQYNTTIYGDDDRYRGITGERRVIFMNTYDMAALHIHEGQWVDITSHFRGTTRTATGFLVVPYDMPRGAAASYFPEANALVPLESVAARSNTPTSKWIEISLALSPQQRI